MTRPIPFTTEDLLTATAGELLSGGSGGSFGGISINSKEAGPDDVFVAIIGANHDGHTFIPDVLGSHGKALIVDRDHAREVLSQDLKKRSITCVVVSDTTRALGDLATYQRRRADVTVTALTGSSGKTTTRTMVAQVVAQQFDTLSTTGNLNNEIGLPLTLLKLGRDHQQAVVELGMNHFGEITRLTHICRPDIGVITNIGSAHLEGVGSLDGVMQAKGELLAEMDTAGTAILNADDARIMRLKDQWKGNTLLYGFSDSADIRGKVIETNDSQVRFTLMLPDGEQEVTLNACGLFNVSNALCAAAVGCHLEVPAVAIVKGIAAFQPVKGRMNILPGPNDTTIVDDTYNANPDSVRCALDAFQGLRKNHRGIAVLGDMFELGEQARQLHEEIGRLAALSGITSLYLTGNHADAVAKGAKTAMNEMQIYIGAKNDLMLQLKQNLASGDWLLVKGSRAMKMEKIVEGLKESIIERTARKLESL